jgi:hypothetical protein
MTFVSKNRVRHTTAGAISLHHDMDEAAEIYFGLWNGPCKPFHGWSRRHQAEIVTAGCQAVFSSEPHPELKVGQRIRFTMGHDALGIESVAVNIEPVSDTDALPIEWVGPHAVEPVATVQEPVTIEAPKVAARKSK